ncbi:MAG: hypothetical protein JM58_05600 [Peptococcaceae bacterium BICA1-8]|nr:MAG: hypothetical protein JM58_05600 [Peptococcaceae bacterium BICA1-8]
MQREKLFKYAIIFLLVLNIFSVGKLSSIENELSNQKNYINSRMDSVASEVRSASSNISNFVREEQWIAGSYSKLKLDPTSQVFTADVNWTFRELAKDDTKVFLLYKKVSEAGWERVEAKNTGGLNYTAVFELTSEENYDTQVLVESSAGEKSQQLTFVSAENLFQGVYDLNFGAYSSSTQNNGEIGWNINLVEFNGYKEPGLESFIIKYVQAELYEGDKFIGKRTFVKGEAIPEHITDWQLNGQANGKITGTIYIYFENGYVRQEVIRL